MRVKLGEDGSQLRTNEVWLLLNALSKFLGVRVDRLARSGANVALNLTPVLAIKVHCLDEALMLLISPIPITSSTPVVLHIVSLTLIIEALTMELRFFSSLLVALAGRMQILLT